MGRKAVRGEEGKRFGATCMTVGLSRQIGGVVLRLLLTERPACGFPEAQAGKESSGLEPALLGRPALHPASAPVRASGNGHFLLQQEISSLALRKGLEPFQLRGSFSVKRLGYAQSLEYTPRDPTVQNNSVYYQNILRDAFRCRA